MAAEGPITSGAYILHHLTYLQLDLETWKIVKGSTLKVYPGAPHGLFVTHMEQVNRDLEAFLKA